MLLLLIRFLHSRLGIHIPAAFSYSSTRMLLAAITTLLITIVLGPYVINRLYVLKTGQSIRVEDCPMLVELHKKKKNTPTMGGVLILCSMVISLILWMDLTSSYTLLFLISTLYLGFLGGWDDYLKMKHKNSRGLAGKKKLILQLILAFGVGGFLIWGPSAPTAKMQTYRNEPRQVNAHSETLKSEQLMGTYFLPFKKGA